MLSPFAIKECIYTSTQSKGLLLDGRYTESPVCKMNVAVFSIFLLAAVELGVELDCCRPHILSECLLKRAALKYMFGRQVFKTAVAGW